MISVFVVHSIEQEAGIIGTLYAMGVRKNELLRHYLALPVLITLIAGIVGTALGYSDFGVRVQMEECYGYFSIPALDTIYEPYLLVYGIVMPPVVAALEIDSGRLYAATSKEEIEENSSVFVEQMMPMVSTLTIVSALIFVVVMYLMMKVMIDRSAMSISLMKVFGYRKKEVRKLYLNGNLLIVAASALIGIPLSKVMMDGMYPYLVSNIACGINLTFSWQMYTGLFGAILLLYFIINRILMRRVNKILPAEVLKNRE